MEMATAVLEKRPLVSPHWWPDDSQLDDIITEDDTPVDNFASEKQQRFLTQSLYSCKDELPFKWPFVVAANVGIFPDFNETPIVPDVFLSLSVDIPTDWWQTRKRTYFVSNFGKVPEIAIEIVSNKKGNEDGTKKTDYAQLGILYYVIYDPSMQLSQNILRAYTLHRGKYLQLKHLWFPVLGLGLQLWDGEFEGRQQTWLRWCDGQGQIIPTGDERAELERQQKLQAQQHAEQAQQEKLQERQAKEKLAAKLREMGIDPMTIL